MENKPFASSKFRVLIPVILDLFVPILIYFVLHALGLNDFLALTIGGALSGINATVDVIRKRSARGISLLVFLLFAVSIALVLITQDARIILLKPTIFIEIAGVYILTTTFRTPFILSSIEPFATRGNPALLERWNHAWKNSPEFRRRINMANAITGVGVMLEGIARAIIALSFPIQTAVLLYNAPTILLILLLALVGRFYIKGAGEVAMGKRGQPCPDTLSFQEK